ncbi:MAG: tetrahydromethanopterin S-methyltransferase subunit C [archaeon]|nr:tetrahydromethanopterin S-methyltransferase subunit C [archaeon]
MTVTPAVEEEVVAAKPKKGFTFPGDETNLGIIAGVIATIIVLIPGLPAVIKAVGMIFAFLWGMDSVRKTSKYGLGTGVPSIGVLATGYGIIGALVGVACAHFVGSIGPVAPGVLGGVVLMAIVGYLSGVCSNHEKIIGMKIPKLERGMMELGMAGTIGILLEFSIIAGSFDFGLVVEKAISSGLVAIMFILGGMSMLHPYNACLGPDERRERTMMVSVEISGLLSVILGIALLVMGSPWGIGDGISLIIFGAIVWIVFYRRFIQACMKECYATVGTGLIKTIG